MALNPSTTLRGEGCEGGLYEVHLRGRYYPPFVKREVRRDFVEDSFDSSQQVLKNLDIAAPFKYPLAKG